MLDENRIADTYKTWVSLAEYKAFAGRDPAVRDLIMGADGRLLNQTELAAMPWYTATTEELGWNSTPSSSTRASSVGVLVAVAIAVIAMAIE